MAIVKAYRKDALDFWFFPQHKAGIPDIIREIEARFEKKHGRKPFSVISLSVNERVDVESLSLEDRKGWAEGAKTIPVLSFEVK